MAIIIGIDPGKGGAIARVSHGVGEKVIDLPYLAETPDVVSILSELGVADLIVLEKQQAMPRQGVSTTFQTGLGYGALLAACYLSGVRIELVHPSVWKRKLGLVGKDKEASRALAIRLFPSLAEHLRRKKDEGRAEALLLAAYGQRL